MKQVAQRVATIWENYSSLFVPFIALLPVLTGILFLELPDGSLERFSVIKQTLTVFIIFGFWELLLKLIVRLKVLTNTNDNNAGPIKSLSLLSKREQILLVLSIVILMLSTLSFSQYSGVSALSYLIGYFTFSLLFSMIKTLSPTPRFHLFSKTLGLTIIGALSCRIIYGDTNPSFWVVALSMAVIAVTPQIPSLYDASDELSLKYRTKFLRLFLIAPPFLISLLTFTGQLNSLYLLTFIPLIKQSSYAGKGASPSIAYLTANSGLFVLVIAACRIF